MTSKSTKKKSVLQKIFEDRNIEYRQTENLNDVQSNNPKKNTMMVKDIERAKLEDSREEE